MFDMRGVLMYQEILECDSPVHDKRATRHNLRKIEVDVIEASFLLLQKGELHIERDSSDEPEEDDPEDEPIDIPSILEIEDDDDG
jgi:hypothetical protein